LPEGVVGGYVVMASPDPESVVNVTDVEGQVWSEDWEQGIKLVNTVV
jgi:hypothetical protein